MAKISDEFIFVKDYLNNEKFPIKNNTPLIHDDKEYKKSYNLLSWVKENSKMNIEMNEKSRKNYHNYTPSINQNVVSTYPNNDTKISINKGYKTINGDDFSKKSSTKPTDLGRRRQEDASNNGKDLITDLKNASNENNIYEKLHHKNKDNINKKNCINNNNNCKDINVNISTNNNQKNNINYTNNISSNHKNNKSNNKNNNINNNNNRNNNKNNNSCYDMILYKERLVYSSLTGVSCGLESFGSEKDVNDKKLLQLDYSQILVNYKDHNMKVDKKNDGFYVSEFLHCYHNSKNSTSKKTKVFVFLQSANQTPQTTKTTTEANPTTSLKHSYLYKIDTSKKHLIIYPYEEFLNFINGNNDGGKLVEKSLGFDGVYIENNLKMCLENCVEMLKAFMEEKPVCFLMCDDGQNTEDSLFMDLRAKNGFDNTDLINNNIKNLENDNSNFDLIFHCLKWVEALIQHHNGNTHAITRDKLLEAHQRKVNIEFNICAIVFDMKSDTYEKVLFEEGENKLDSADFSKLMILQKSLKQKIKNKSYILNINVRTENTPVKGFDMINTLTFVKVTNILSEETEHLKTFNDTSADCNGDSHVETIPQRVLNLMAGQKPRENHKVDKLLLKYLSSSKRNCHCNLLIKLQQCKNLTGFTQDSSIGNQNNGLRNVLTLQQYRLLTAATKVYKRRLRKATYHISTQSSDSETSSVMMGSTGGRSKKSRGKVLMGTKQYKTNGDTKSRHSKIYGIKDSSKYERLLMEKRLSYEDPTVFSVKTPVQSHSSNNTLSNDSYSKHSIKPIKVANEVWIDGPGTSTLMNCDVEEELDELHKICTSMNSEISKPNVETIFNETINDGFKKDTLDGKAKCDSFENKEKNLKTNFSDDIYYFNIREKQRTGENSNKYSQESFCDTGSTMIMTNTFTKQAVKNSLKSLKLEITSGMFLEKNNQEKLIKENPMNSNSKNNKRPKDLKVPMNHYKKSEVEWRNNSKTLDIKELSNGKQNCIDREYHTNSLGSKKSQSGKNKPHVLTRFSLSSLFNDLKQETKDNSKANKNVEINEMEIMKIKKLDIIPEDEYYEEKLEKILEIKENNDQYSNNNTINDKMENFIKHYTENSCSGNNDQKNYENRNNLNEIKTSQISDINKKTYSDNGTKKCFDSQPKALKLVTNEIPLSTVPPCKPLSLSLLSKPIFFTPQMNRACVSNQFTRPTHKTRLYEPLPPIKHIKSFNDVQNIFPTPPDTPGSNELTLSTIFNTSNEKTSSFINSNIPSKPCQAPTSPLVSTGWSLMTQQKSHHYVRSTSLNENCLSQQNQFDQNNVIVKTTKESSSPKFKSLRRSWFFKIFKKSKKDQNDNYEESMDKEITEKVPSSVYNLTPWKTSFNNLPFHFNNKIDNKENVNADLNRNQSNKTKYLANYDLENANRMNGTTPCQNVSTNTQVYNTEMKHLHLLDMYTEQCNNDFKDIREENKSKDLPDFIINMNNSYSNAFIEDINSSYVDVSGISKKDNDSYISMKNYLNTPSLHTSTPKNKKVNENYALFEFSQKNSHYKNRHTKIYKSNFLNSSNDNIIEENNMVFNRNKNELLSNSFHGSEHFKNYPINEFCSNNIQTTEHFFQFSTAPNTPSTPKLFAKKHTTTPSTPRMMKLELKPISNQNSPQPCHFMSNHMSNYPFFMNDSNKKLSQPLKRPSFLNIHDGNFGINSYNKMTTRESSNFLNESENKKKNISKIQNYGYRNDNVINMIDKIKLEKVKYNEKLQQNSMDRKQQSRRNTPNTFYRNEAHPALLKDPTGNRNNKEGKIQCRIDSDTESGVASVANVTCLKVLKTSKKKNHKNSMSYYSFSRISSSEEDIDDYESLKTYQK